MRFLLQPPPVPPQGNLPSTLCNIASRSKHVAQFGRVPLSSPSHGPQAQSFRSPEVAQSKNKNGGVQVLQGFLLPVWAVAPKARFGQSLSWDFPNHLPQQSWYDGRVTEVPRADKDSGPNSPKLALGSDTYRLPSTRRLQKTMTLKKVQSKLSTLLTGPRRGRPARRRRKRRHGAWRGRSIAFLVPLPDRGPWVGCITILDKVDVFVVAKMLQG